MGFKEVIQNMGSKNKEKKELLSGALEQDRIQNIVEERKKSANERELERYMKEGREKEIKKQLDFVRKVRDKEFNMGHNILKVKNITSKSDFEILKEKNIFPNNNMFKNQKRVY